MKAYITLNNELCVESLFLDRVDGAIEVDIPKETDISKIHCFQYIKNEFVFNAERERLLNARREQYLNQPLPPTTEERLQSTEAAILALMEVLG